MTDVREVIARRAAQELLSLTAETGFYVRPRLAEVQEPALRNAAK